MLTANYMGMPMSFELQHYLDDELMWNAVPFGMATRIDAPNTMPAGGHYRYDSIDHTYAWPMPSSCRRPR